jgi:hypothetical protein
MFVVVGAAVLRPPRNPIKPEIAVLSVMTSSPPPANPFQSSQQPPTVAVIARVEMQIMVKAV